MQSHSRVADVAGKRTVRLGALTAVLLVIAFVFAAFRVGVVAAIFILSATATALGTLWAWWDEGRPLRPWPVVMVVLAALTVFFVVSVGLADVT